MQLLGYKCCYLTWVDCKSQLPTTMNAFKVQQQRWTQGSVEVGRKLFRPLMRSNEKFFTKLEALIHLWAPLNYFIALMLLLLTPLVVVYRPYSPSLLRAEMFLFLLSFCSLGIYYAVAQVELGNGWRQTVVSLPMLIAMGIALIVNNTWAILKAFSKGSGEFIRTPKFAVTGSGSTLVKSRYLTGTSYLVILEVLALGYLIVGLGYVVYQGNWMGVPLMVLFTFSLLFVIYQSIVSPK